MSDRALPVRPLLALGAAALVIGTWAGLARIGVGIAVPRAEWVGLHGPLMASGFFGTVICAERAVAVRKPAALLVPLLSGLGALAVAAGVPAYLGAGASVLSSVGLVAIVLWAITRAPSLDLVVSAAGAASWLAGNAMWLAGRPIPDAAFAWVGFLALTVGAERLELTRVVPRPAYAKALFALASALVLIAPGVTFMGEHAFMGAHTPHDIAGRVLGAGALGLGVWLLVWDVARRTIVRRGLPRFAAACMLTGSAWLALAGATALALGTNGSAYDAVLHAVFLGFAFSMIFGHAPTVLAAVARIEVRYAPRFWAHLVLLHVSVTARVVADLVPAVSAVRPWAGALHAVALVVFIASTLGGIVRGPPRTTATWRARGRAPPRSTR